MQSAESRQRVFHRLAGDVAVGLFAVAALMLFRSASAMHLTAAPGEALWPTPTGHPTFWLLAVMLALLAWRLLGTMVVLGRSVARRPLRDGLAGDRGAAAVSFVLVLPIFLIVVGAIVQLALIANAAVVLNYAAFVAARSAITSAPDGKANHPRRAATMVTTSISPAGRGIGSSRAQARNIQKVLRRSGVRMPDRYERRYGYAAAVTRVAIKPSVSARSSPRDVRATVTYKFELTVPGAMQILAPRATTIAGVRGHFYSMQAACTLRSTPGRSNGSGVLGTLGGFL